MKLFFKYRESRKQGYLSEAHPIFCKYSYILFIPALLILGFIQISCIDRAKTEFRKTKDLRDIIGEQFVLPSDVSWRILDKDTVIDISPCTKLVVYFNGNGCTPCALKELRHWKPITERIALLNKEGSDTQAIFILHAEPDDKIITDAILEQGFVHSIMYDPKGEFERFNLLPENSLMHTFILDRENKVKHVGNPLLRQKGWDIFEHVLMLQAKN